MCDGSGCHVSHYDNQAIGDPSYWHMVPLEMESASKGIVTFKLLSLRPTADLVNQQEDTCSLETPNESMEVSGMWVCCVGMSNVVYFQEEELGVSSCTITELIGVLERRDSNSVRLALRSVHTWLCSISRCLCNPLDC